MKNKKPTIVDKSLANAVKKGEISISNLDKDKKKTIKNILITNTDKELEKASKNKYKFSKRKIKHKSKKKNESMENNGKRIATDIEKWSNKKEISDFDKLYDFEEEEIQENYMPSYRYEESDWERNHHKDDFDDDFDDNFDDDFDDDFDNDLDNDFDNDLDDDFDNDLDDDFDNNEELSLDDDIYHKKDRIVQESGSIIKKFNNFIKLNENELNEPKMYPRKNKFKRTIEYSPEIEKSLIEHNFSKIESDGKFLIFDLMDKSFELINDFPDDIRPVTLPEFDHMMDNL